MHTSKMKKNDRLLSLLHVHRAVTPRFGPRPVRETPPQFTNLRDPPNGGAYAYEKEPWFGRSSAAARVPPPAYGTPVGGYAYGAPTAQFMTSPPPPPPATSRYAYDEDEENVPPGSQANGAYK